MLEVAFKQCRLTTCVTGGLLLHQGAAEVVRGKLDTIIKLMPMHLEESHPIRCGDEYLIIRSDAPELDMRCVRYVEYYGTLRKFERIERGGRLDSWYMGYYID